MMCRQGTEAAGPLRTHGRKTLVGSISSPRDSDPGMLRRQRGSSHISWCEADFARIIKPNLPHPSDLPERRILRASGRLGVYKTPTNSPSGALRLVTGKYYLPDARNE